MEGKTKIYLVRHGTTDDNRKGIFQGSRDVPLGKLGKKQAECLQKKFADIELDAVYTSPLMRAAETAEQIQKAGKVPLFRLDGLRAVNCGALEGHNSTYNQKMYPEAMYAMHYHPAAFRAPGAESGLEAYERIVKTIDGIAAKHPGGTVAIVSHGFVIQLYLGYAKHVALSEIEPYIVGNCSVCELSYDNKGAVVLERMNDEDHIPENIRFFEAEDFLHA